MIVEYYVEYYDPKGRRGFTQYYLTEKEANDKAERLKEQGYNNISVIPFKY